MCSCSSSYSAWRGFGTCTGSIITLLKPRTPLDCPACRLSSTLSSGMGRSPLPVRPWREVKSQRGAPKRVNTEGFACPNHQCPYFGITDAHIHALVGTVTVIYERNGADKSMYRRCLLEEWICLKSGVWISCG